MCDQLIDLVGCRVVRAWRRFPDVTLAELLHRVGVDVVPCDSAGAEATQGRQITTDRRALGTRLHAFARIIGEPTTGDLIEVETAERRCQLAKSCSVSLLRSE